MVDTVIFDMDGVIIDSEPIHMEVEQELFRSLGINVSREKHFTFVGTSGKNMWERIISEYGVEKSVDELLALNKSAYRARLANAGDSEVRGVKSLIINLHTAGIKLAVASSSVPEDIDTVLSMFGLKHYFRECVSGALVQFSKPHPEIFIKTAALLNSLPENCVVIEDSTNGVRAAKSAGMKCIGFSNPNSGDQDLRAADLIVPAITELTREQILAL